MGFSNQIAKLANRVCGGAFGIADYRTSLSESVGQAAWNGAQAIWEEMPSHNRTMMLRLAAFTDDWSPAKMSRKALSAGKDYFALVYALVHRDELDAPFASWRVEAVLRSAPCGGPCWKTSGCSNTPGWRSESRNYRAEHRMGTWYAQHAEFNGLDYMALFAAWHLYLDGVWEVHAPDPAGPCTGGVSLDNVLGSSPPASGHWDATNPCTAQDLARTFCGRPFGAWVRDAARGAVTIWSNGLRWNCTTEGICTFTPSSDENTGATTSSWGRPAMMISPAVAEMTVS